jgi:hypothetical protein
MGSDICLYIFVCLHIDSIFSENIIIFVLSFRSSLLKAVCYAELSYSLSRLANQDSALQVLQSVEWSLRTLGRQSVLQGVGNTRCQTGCHDTPAPFSLYVIYIYITIHHVGKNCFLPLLLLFPHNSIKWDETGKCSPSILMFVFWTSLKSRWLHIYIYIYIYIYIGVQTSVL